MNDINDFNKLGTRDEHFQSVSLPSHEDMEFNTDSQGERFTSSSMVERPLSQPNSPTARAAQSYTPTILDYRTRRGSGSPIRSNGPAGRSPIKFGRMDMTLREDQGDKPNSSSTSEARRSTADAHTDQGKALKTTDYSAKQIQVVRSGDTILIYFVSLKWSSENG